MPSFDDVGPMPAAISDVGEGQSSTINVVEPPPSAAAVMRAADVERCSDSVSSGRGSSGIRENELWRSPMGAPWNMVRQEGD